MVKRLMCSGVAVLGLLAAQPAQAEQLNAMLPDGALPAGSMAFYGSLGFPSVLLGYRQGVGPVELGVEGGFDYALAQLTAGVPLRVDVPVKGPYHLAMGFELGGFASFGAKYYEVTNRPSFGMSLKAMGDLSYHVNEAIDLVGSLQVPVQVPFTESGNYLVGARLGGGAEVAVGDGYTVGGQALVGPQLLRPIGGQATARLDLTVQVGLGKRFF
jgi:hypothetical protein